MKVGQGRESVRTGTCSVPNSHKKTITMGRGKEWSSNEREKVAIAWSRATHDPVMGHNQSGDTFDEKVYSLFSRKPPKDAEPGSYNDHSHPSVMTCF